MNLTQEEVQAWWNEVECLVKEMVKPCVPTPILPVEKNKELAKFIKGNTYYTLINDMQFAVDSDYPKAVGWNYE